MTPQERTVLIERYKDGYRVVQDALAGASDAEWNARPNPGAWSAREIVHHLADSESTSGFRLRLLLASDSPVIQGYDQDAFATRLAYQDRPIDDALEVFRLARKTTASLFERMTEADWQRTGTHTESGAYSVLRWLEIYAAHAHNHAEQIRRALYIGGARVTRAQRGRQNAQRGRERAQRKAHRRVRRGAEGSRR